MQGDALAQSKNINSTIAEVFGGEEQLKASVQAGMKSPTSHSFRKTGASAAYCSGVDKVKLQRWGEWSTGKADNPDFWGALKNYVDTKYETSEWSRKLFDWLR